MTNDANDTLAVEQPLPCPFCGCEPMPDYCSTNDGPAYLFHCQSIDCPAWPNVAGETEAEAIAAWNKRLTPPVANGLREALVALADAAERIGREYNIVQPLLTVYKRHGKTIEAARTHLANKSDSTGDTPTDGVREAVLLASNFKDMLEAHCENTDEELDPDDRALVEHWKQRLAALSPVCGDGG